MILFRKMTSPGQTVGEVCRSLQFNKQGYGDLAEAVRSIKTSLWQHGIPLYVPGIITVLRWPSPQPAAESVRHLRWVRQR